MEHFRVQLIGGIILHQGRIAEMRTGEGKTLVSTLPAYLNALEGKGVHIVTVNDYLAKRDAEWMGAVHRFLGLTVGVVLNDMTKEERQEAYIDYSLTFPIGLLGDYTYDVSQRARCRKWVGYENANNKSDCRYVYITEHGEVYHSNYYCTYLNPSVHRILVNQVSSARNKGGATYKKCHRCGWSKAKG